MKYYHYLFLVSMILIRRYRFFTLPKSGIIARGNSFPSYKKIKPILDIPVYPSLSISMSEKVESVVETETEILPVVENSKIKHMVLSGGGALGFAFYGTLRESHLRGIWKHEDIETIYATSVGTIMAVTISLGYDWNILDDFFVKRPWQHVFKFQLPMAWNIISKQGIFDQSCMHTLFQPLFRGKDISMNITLLEFYERTKREIHFIATETNHMKLEDISYKTHPEWKVVDAVYASCCLPGLFVPHYYYDYQEETKDKDNLLFPRSPDKSFMDGGIMMHFPLNLCLAAGHKSEETMAILRESKNEQDNLHPSQTIFEIMCSLILKLIDKIKEPLMQEKIAYTFEIRVSNYSLYTFIYNSIYSENTRKELIQSGVDAVIFSS